jgi:hypothetical protein
MANPIQRLFSGLSSKPKSVAPTKEIGTAGYAIYSGVITSNERNPKLTYDKKWETWADVVANVSIVSAGLRHWQNLLARPEWTVSPAYDLGDDSSDEAKAAAEFVQECIDELYTGWSRQIKRASTYRYYGFYAGEWTAYRRDDGYFGVKDIEVRPQHTIERWDVDERGTVQGLVQRSPQTNEYILLPRSRLVYIVDDALTDSPEGLGILRQLTEPAERLKEYLRLEGMGFERDLRGIPIGYAPLGEIFEAVRNGDLTQEQAAQKIQFLKDFVSMEAKSKNTSMVLPSDRFETIDDSGKKVTGERKYDIEILSANASGLTELGNAIQRVNEEMARIMGVESMLLGSGSSGSRSLGEDKSRNLYLQADATLTDIKEAFERDFIGPLWRLNGFDDALRPSLEVESVQPKDIDAMGKAISDISRSGVMLDREDAAVKEYFGLLGLTAPEADAMGAMLRQTDAEAEA